jgi:hypothetical protein
MRDAKFGVEASPFPLVGASSEGKTAEYVYGAMERVVAVVIADGTI